MDIVRPIPVTPGMVVTNAVDADPQWLIGATYANGAKVTHNRVIWISAAAGNVGHEPGAAGSEAWWAAAGSANSWAMFDDEVGTVTTRADNITVSISPIGAPNVAVLNVRARTVRCVSMHGATKVYDKTIELWDTAVITDWGEYFFNEPEFRTEAIFEGLPAVPGQTVTITLSAAGAVAQCGMVIVGKPFSVGLELLGLNRSGTDFSTVTFNDGKATIRRLGYARDVSTQTMLENSAFDRIARRLDQISNVPVLVLSGRPRFNSTVVYGTVSYSLDLKLYEYSYASIEIKGWI